MPEDVIENEVFEDVKKEVKEIGATSKKNFEEINKNYEEIKKLVDENEKNKDTLLQEKIAKSYLFRRLAQPEDHANAVAFLASDESNYITGQTISVSSGYTMI